MVKLLRPTTIIPSHLYVERDADRQLDQIIEDMGRPGYVLVARQMGKTNLLINMKRRREQGGDCVVYFDLTSRASSPRSFFRNVIDQLLETLGSEGSEVASEISGLRITQTLPANAEYDRHLRAILRAIPERKFILIFDEIDSLTNVDYSDSVFSQIRSMYFSRTNYPEYDRITYVLSGVAEPSDLIKDKSISPFNIGEKIYLDDFSAKEFSSLLDRAQLKFPPDVVTAIYQWTAGNPRMTWDVCSELEDVSLAGKSLDVGEVDRAVQKLYLDRYDRAPVDHIRTLAENDTEVRNAIISIRWGKADTLDERAKSRLYLSGICGLRTGQSPTIKNRILETALSDAWLAQIASRKKGLLDVATENFGARKYKETIKLISEYIADGNGGERKLPVLNLIQFGIAKYFAEDFDGAVLALKDALASEIPDTELALTCRFHLGSALLRRGAPNEALPYFRQVSGERGPLHFAARLAIGTALLLHSAEQNEEELISVNDALIAELSTTPTPLTPEIQEILAAAHFNLAQTYREIGQKEKALEHIESAASVAQASAMPAVLWKKAMLLGPPASVGIVSEAAHIILEQRLTLKSGPTSALNLSGEILASLMSFLLRYDDRETFDQLFSYVRSHIYGGSRRPFKVLCDLFNTSKTTAEAAVNSKLLALALSDFVEDSSEPADVEDAYRNCAMHAVADDREGAIARYMERIPSRLEKGMTFSDDDLLLLIDQIYSLNDKQEYKKAQALIDTAKTIVRATSNPNSVFVSAILYQDMVSRRKLGDGKEARIAAEKLLEIIASNPTPGTAELTGLVANIKREAEALLRMAEPDPYRKIGRNQRVVVKQIASGKQIECKFKRIESELRSGQAILLDPVLTNLK